MLPDRASWRFDEIAALEPKRALKLEAAGSSGELIEAIVDKLAAAIASKTIRLGRERARDHSADCRIVLQFDVGADIFDWFFNARTGYRAHFRAAAQLGLLFNDDVITAIREHVGASLPSALVGREIVGEFEDGGEVAITKEFVLASLVPDLAKVWLCTKRIRGDGEIEDLQPAVTGPRLKLGEELFWPAPYREGNEAWLDIKGAFLDDAGCAYQPKSPVERASRLHRRGTA